MKVVWADPAVEDVERLDCFLRPLNPRAADAMLVALRDGASSLAELPRRGIRIPHDSGGELRRLIVGSYKLHYQIEAEAVRIVHVFHSRELG